MIKILYQLMMFLIIDPVSTLTLPSALPNHLTAFLHTTMLAEAILL